MQEATGFSNVMRLIREARKPVIGHNMLFDVVYTLNMFVADFTDWGPFRFAVQNWFPAGLYDTKYICKELTKTNPELIAGTSLGSLYTGLQSTDPSAPHNALFKMGDNQREYVHTSAFVAANILVSSPWTLFIRIM